jgi:hypothetical protein
MDDEVKIEMFFSGGQVVNEEAEEEFLDGAVQALDTQHPYLGKGTVIKQEIKQLDPRTVCRSKTCVKTIRGARHI